MSSRAGFKEPLAPLSEFDMRTQMRGPRWRRPSDRPRGAIAVAALAAAPSVRREEERTQRRGR